MAEQERIDQDTVKVGDPPKPGEQPIPDRDRQKLANQKQRLGGGKDRRVTPPQATRRDR